jgi:hypothetical protein
VGSLVETSGVFMLRNQVLQRGSGPTHVESVALIGNLQYQDTTAAEDPIPFAQTGDWKRHVFKNMVGYDEVKTAVSKRQALRIGNRIENYQPLACFRVVNLQVVGIETVQVPNGGPPRNGKLSPEGSYLNSSSAQMARE